MKMLKTALAATAAALALASPLSAQQASRVSVSIDTAHPGPVIDPAVQGQFAENLGRGLYDGIWVGHNSNIPNRNGFRTDVLEALKQIHVPVVRWPGGCFADTYDWRDGIGPLSERPVGINTNWGGVNDDNSFGTNEFMNYSEALGADAYVSGNMGSLPPYTMRKWAEYITDGGDGAMARLRRANGRDKPWTNLKYWGFGNESWGCGGHMTAEYSTDLHNRYATFVNPAPDAPDFVKVAAGPHDDLYDWTEKLMQKSKDRLGAISLHYYVFPYGWDHKGPALGFDEDAWAITLEKARHIEELIAKHSAIMDKYDPEKKVGLYVDEWGTWYDPEPGSNPGFLYQQNSLRDAQVAALTLNIFHRHSDRVKLAAIAQMVNVLQAMILTKGDKMVRTPTYWVFDMYKVFQGATPYPVAIDTPDYRYGDHDVPMVDVSAAKAKDGKLYLALVNSDPHKAAHVVTGMNGSASGQILTGPAMDTHNSFDAPDTIHPVAFSGTKDGGKLAFDLPAKSVAVVEVQQR